MRLGELLRETEKASGAKGIGPIAVPIENRNPTLADLGVSKKQSHLAQKAASVPAKKREAYIAENKERHAMKAELRVKPHSVLPGVQIIEVWHDGRFVATVTGADGPGVRVISKHAMTARPAPEDGSGINVLEIVVRPE